MVSTRREAFEVAQAEPATTPKVAPVRVGVIGTGFGAMVHLPALEHLVETEVVAICSRRAERARAAAIDHDIPAHLTDYRELVRDPVATVRGIYDGVGRVLDPAVETQLAAWAAEHSQHQHGPHR